MKNNINLFKTDRNISDKYKISKSINLNIKKFLHSKNYNEFINLFKKYFKLQSENVKKMKIKNPSSYWFKSDTVSDRFFKHLKKFN